jgi:imidazole glycerol phosphate synthase subunit HisF
MNVTTPEPAPRAVVIVPNGAVARGRALDLTAHLTTDLDEVVLDFRDADYVAPGFCDELIRQVAQRRHARVIRAPGASENQHGWLARAMRLRQCDGKLVA